MSADSVVVPASGESLPVFANDRLAFDAVDALEITARLEASGLSDRTVRRRHGATDVFEYAQSLVQVVREPAQASPILQGWLGRAALLDAVCRAVVLILGAVLGGLTATVMATNTREVLIAGISAWVVGQSISGIVWAHAGAGQLDRGIARGTGAALLIMLGLAGFLGVLLLLPRHDATLAGLIMAWCWYSCVVSMLVILGRSRFLLTVLAIAVAAVLLALALGHQAAPAIVLTLAILAIAAVTGALAKHLRTVSEPRTPDPGDLRAALPPAAQAGFLAAALTIALIRLPAWEGTALVVATVVAAAATDPALVLMRQRLLWSSNRTPLLRHAARHARSLTMAMSAAIVVISGSVSILVVVFMVEDHRAAATVIVAAAFSALATTATTLAAFGLPRGGVVFAAAAFLSSAVWVTLGDIPGMLVAMVFLVAGIVVLLARVSDPRAYA
ncbi:hypothetical protein KKR91_06055 [Arthrobacter jiangjiafuii]|uniref:Uncharacterized protein n=1 Tax=Arthrobacter jiangjiafuii TaxID=2817475 RepID=A0A975M705_9MICC|nr:hypothetical protein [Arthrobacter jiangjiafuii]MBP3044168.1 hypothetical protein [Arthrobacter jiangjiafuii]QWC11138.1 hypothetical protein KKR91_06055 [Arthrobacter jiangjiafuii]